MRLIVACLLLSTTLFVSCSKPSDGSPAQTAGDAKQPADSPGAFLTDFGKLSPKDSKWSVQVDAAERKATVTFGTGNAAPVIHPPTWRAQSGWFAHVSGDNRLWLYDGQTQLMIFEINATGDVAYYGIWNYPRPVPAAIRSRLSPDAQKQLKQ